LLFLAPSLSPSALDADYRVLKRRGGGGNDDDDDDDGM